MTLNIFNRSNNKMNTEKLWFIIITLVKDNSLGAKSCFNSILKQKGKIWKN